jgi:hypothetical protein
MGAWIEISLFPPYWLSYAAAGNMWIKVVGLYATCQKPHRHVLRKDPTEASTNILLK